MNVLQIAPQIPLPLSDGGKVGIFNITKHLAERNHQITFVCFDSGESIDTSLLERICEFIPVRHNTRNSLLGAAKNIFSTVPYNISKYQSQAMVGQILNLMDNNRFDIVHIDHLHMARYGILCKRRYATPIVLREHNIESTIVERYAATVSHPLLRRYLKRQSARINDYESTAVADFDAVAVITKSDEARLLSMQPRARTTVIPGGVEKKYFMDFESVSPAPDSMVFFGGFDWLPNVDAIEWFLNAILPLILKERPDAVLTVVGKKVPASLQRFESKNVVFKGYVEDLASEIRKHCVSLAPYRVGGGIRLKILESFAMRIPVVSTTTGCEGIECSHANDILIADSEPSYAQSIIRLFDDSALRSMIVANAFRLAQQRYTWESVAHQFEHLYGKVIHDRRQPNG